jgi:hypothetical protein
MFCAKLHSDMSLIRLVVVLTMQTKLSYKNPPCLNLFIKLIQWIFLINFIENKHIDGSYWNSIRPGIYTVYHNEFAKISDFLRRSFLEGYQRKQEMKQDENEYLLNHRLWYKFNYDRNLYIVWILQKVYSMYKILNTRYRHLSSKSCL